MQKKERYKLECTLPDLSEYVVERDVPIFNNGSLSEDDEGFKPEAELQQIVDNTNARQGSCDLPVIAIGHKQDNVPEHLHPPIIGYCKNFRLVDFNSKPTIIADLYASKSHANALKEYPRRSAEIWENDAYIDRVALLGDTTPARDLSLTYSKAEEITRNLGKQDKYSKAAERGFMDAEEIAGAVLKALESTGLFEVLKKLQGEEDQVSNDLGDGLGESYEMDEAPAPAEEAMQEMPEEENTEEYSAAKRKLARYSKQLEAQEARIRELERTARRAERKNDLMQLESEGYQFEFAEELNEVTDLEPAKYAKHLERIKRNYQKAPLGSMIPTAVPTAPKEHTYEDSARAADMVISGKAKTISEALKLIRGGN